MPSSEAAKTAREEVCIGLSPRTTLLFAVRAGVQGSEGSSARAYQGKKTVLLGGWFDGEIDHPDLTSSVVSKGDDGMLIELDPSLGLVGFRQVGGFDRQRIHAIEVVPAHEPEAGSLYVAGTFAGVLSLGGQMESEQYDGLVAKLDARNATEWVQRYGDDKKDLSEADQELVALGRYPGSATPSGPGERLAIGGRFNGKAFNLPLFGDDDGFLALVDAATPQPPALWARHIGDGESGVYQDVLAIAFRPDASVVAAGSYQGILDFGGGIRSTDDTSLFVVWYDASGVYLGDTTFASKNGAADQLLGDLVVDPNGEPVLMYVHRAAPKPGGLLVDLAIERLAAGELPPALPKGSVARAKQLGDVRPRLALDGFGRGLVVGQFQDEIHIGGAVHTTAGMGGFVARVATKPLDAY
jgi:hypothetical protein